MHDEFPHTVTFLTKSKVPDGGGGYEYLWTAKMQVNGFMDTPSSREVFEAQQLNATLDRNLFCGYRTDISQTMRCQYDGDTYELVSRPQDQGGQKEVLKVALKLVPHE